MKIIKISAYLFAALSISTSAAGVYAQDMAAPPVKAQTKAILAVVKHYSAAIACSDVAPDANSIAAMIPYKSFDNREDAKFAVIWHGDIGCLGGSGTSSARIAVVKVGAGDSFYVNPSESSPQVDEGLPRYVEKVVGATADSITVDVRDYGDKDANCCPSLRKRLTLRQSAKGNWAVVSTKPLPPAQY